MTIQPLSEDNPISQSVLPSVWAGYVRPAYRPITEAVDQTSQTIQMGFNLSKEESDNISNSFWTGSVHDFCVRYLGQKLSDEDHTKILKTANEFIKNGTSIRIDEKENDLIKLLAAKVVLNAHQRANHVISQACFLNEMGMLPGENMFMLQRGTSPIFYEKDEFDRSEKLKNDAHGVPEDRLLRSFTNWFHRAGMRYIPAFNQMGGLLKDMRNMNALILKEALESYTRGKRVARYRNRPRSRRPIWRSYGE